MQDTFHILHVFCSSNRLIKWVFHRYIHVIWSSENRNGKVGKMEICIAHLFKFCLVTTLFGLICDMRVIFRYLAMVKRQTFCFLLLSCDSSLRFIELVMKNKNWIICVVDVSFCFVFELFGFVSLAKKKLICFSNNFDSVKGYI